MASIRKKGKGGGWVAELYVKGERESGRAR
jgi:hypothetical protein